MSEKVKGSQNNKHKGNDNNAHVYRVSKREKKKKINEWVDARAWVYVCVSMHKFN